jgi:hypothetical protein
MQYALIFHGKHLPQYVCLYYMVCYVTVAALDWTAMIPPSVIPSPGVGVALRLGYIATNLFSFVEVKFFFFFAFEF